MPARTSHNPVPGWCRELEAGFRAGTPGRAEDYLRRAPGLDPEDAVELVYTEYVCREEFGPAPDPAEYLRRFPDLREQLEEQFLVHRTLAPDAGPTDLPPGRAVGPYVLDREIGRGGRGAVFLARDSRDDRPVAVKVLLSGEYATAGDLDLFRRECEVLARLDHPNLVRIAEAGADGGRPYLAMEYADGPPLSECAERYRDPRAAAALVETLARALHHAHGRGVVHRDLKPSNVLLTSGGVPKLGDFGLARVVDARSARTRTGDVVGTLGYMAPEQAAGGSHRAGPAADVYALGAVLYDLLAGRPPFGNEPTARTLFDLFQEPPPPLRGLRPDVPRDLETVCLRCLEKRPANRYPTALALADDLRRFLDGRPVAARPPGAAVRAARWARRRPATAAALGVLAVAAGGLFAGSLYYTARLTVANADLQKSLRTEEELRAEVSGQKEAAERQLDDARRGLYALQLSQLPALWVREPVRARDLLAAEKACPPDLRDFTWHYFRRLCALDQREFAAHKGEAGAVAYLPDGRLLTGGADGRVRGWGAVAGDWRPRFNLPAHAGAVSGVAVLGRDRFATAGQDGAVKVWAGNGPEPERVITAPAAVNGLAADRAGVRLAGACADGVVRVWDAGTGRELAALQGHDGAVLAVAFAPDGRSLFTGGADATVRAWDLVEGTSAVWPGHLGPVLAVAADRDGRAVVSTGERGDVRLWDAAAGTARELRGHLMPVRAAAFSPAGDRVVTGGGDTYLKVWNPADGGELTNVMRSVAHAAAFSPDGLRVAVGTREGRVVVYRLPEPSPPVRFAHPANVGALTPLPGGGMALADAAGAVRVWPTGGATPAVGFRVPPLDRGPDRPLAVTTGAAPVLAVSPDGTTLAVGGGDGTLVLWDLAGRAERGRLKGHTGNVSAAAYLPDGRLVTGGADHTVRVWDAAAGTAVVLRGHTGGVLAVAVSADGRRVASGGEDRTVRVWDPAAPAAPPAVLLPPAHQMWVLSLAFDPAGKRLASGGRDRTVRVWDVERGQQVATLGGYTNWVHGVAFSPDGKTLATASGHHGIDTPGEVKLCDPVAGYVRAILTDVRAPVAFSPDGHRLYAATRGGVAELVGE